MSLELPALPQGRVLDVVRAPAGVLATPGVAVDPADPAVIQLCADLVATMYVSPGCVGLAASVASSKNEKGREGCMSVPDLTGDVKRATRVTIRGQLPVTGETVEIVTDAFEARAMQHELDHCQGLLFLDRVAGAHALHARQVYLEAPTEDSDAAAAD